MKFRGIELPTGSSFGTTASDTCYCRVIVIIVAVVVHLAVVIAVVVFYSDGSKIIESPQISEL